ncbi:MAG: PAS domain S-box protein, partial [Planctomycetes bacterium]|nr:PAS domain S-box protein [Planctomycetota bacterium]
MKSLPSDINELVAVAEVARGGISNASPAWRLPETCEPLLLMFTDASGNVLSADDLGLGTSGEVIGALGKNLAQALVGKRTCLLEMPHDSGAAAVAVRLRASAGAQFAACVVRTPGLSASSPGDLETAVVLCAAFGWTASHYKARISELSTRVAHLKAEHETLKDSQARAVSAAIEEREKRLQQQRQDMAQLEAVMKLAADGIITVNEEGIVKSFNEAAARIFGYDPGELIGQNVAMLSPGPGGHGHQEHLAKYLNLGTAAGASRPREVMGRRKDGTFFPLEIAVSVVPLDSERILTCIFRDIGDRRRLESRLV